ncbi:MAG: ABC transporter ATP-binding protein [Culicoidibacterales bacterium]
MSLKITKGDCISIEGKSGAGKSTLLNILAGIEKPTKGQYYYEGQEMSKFSNNKMAQFRNEEIGYVLQQFALVYEFTVYENIVLPLIYSHVKKSEYAKRVSQALELVGLPGIEHSMCDELSGGQQQRVAIARAIINKPQILLADEPTGSLDTQTGEEILELLLKLNAQGMTVVIVTHDKDISMRCRRNIKISDGKLVEETR